MASPAATSSKIRRQQTRNLADAEVDRFLRRAYEMIPDKTKLFDVGEYANIDRSKAPRVLPLLLGRFVMTALVQEQGEAHIKPKQLQSGMYIYTYIYVYMHI